MFAAWCAQPDRVGPQPHHFRSHRHCVFDLARLDRVAHRTGPGVAVLERRLGRAAARLGFRRFRDVPPVVDSVIRIAFFITPIIWMPDYLPSRFRLHDWNPFLPLSGGGAAPLLGEAPSLVSWLAVLGISCLGWVGTLLMYSRFRRRIAYWV